MIVMLKTLIDPGWAAVRCEDDQRDQDQAEQEGEQVFAGEKVLHFLNTKDTKGTKEKP